MSFLSKKYQSPLGLLLLIEKEGRLRAVIYDSHWSTHEKNFQPLREQETPLLSETARQLTEYFQGQRKNFDLPYELEGTDFQKKVWDALLKIPFGTTVTYQHQANLLNSPKAVRAVGAANGRNPLSVILPCHRVVGSSGRLTGYAGGLEAKEKLLDLEGAL